MTQVSDAYAAAFIEARGRLQTNVGGSKRAYRPGIGVTSTDREILDQLRDYFDVGTVTSFFSPKTPHLEIFAWNLRGQAAIEVLERVTPHMVGPLREHAEFILRPYEQALDNGRN